MASHRLNPVVRLLPSLTDIAFLMPVVFLFTKLDGAKTMLGDGDTGWHLLTGEWILANGRVPVKDIFSFTKPGEPWFAWEWLWDVCFAWLYHHGGLATVVLASILVLCVTFALLFRLVNRHCGNPLISIGATLLACAGSSLHWLARPHLFTLLFLVIFLSILDRVNEGRVRLLIWLPALTVLWTNLHGAFFVGIVVLMAYLGGEVATALVTADSGVRRAALRRARAYAVTALACAGASLINPYAYHLHTHMYTYLTDSFHFRYIMEFMSLSFQNPGAIYFEVMLALGATITAWNLAHRRFTAVLLILGWAHLGLMSARNIPLFMLAAAPIVASGLDELLHRLSQADVAGWIKRGVSKFAEIAAETGAVDRHWRLYPLSILAVLFLTAALHAPHSSTKLKAEYDPKRYPAKALEFIQSRKLAHRIFTDDEWGDYLLFRLYPEQKSFVDGRSDFYGGEFDLKYVDTMNVKYDWEQYLQRYQIDTILLSTTSSLAGAIKESRNWRPVYDDTLAIIFKPVDQRAAEAQKFSTSVSSGKDRDPGITKAVDRDRGITKSKQPKRSITLT